MDGIAVVSGGLDSVTLAYHLSASGRTPDLLSFNYGQRHARELDCAARAADRLGLAWDVVDMPDLADLLSGSGSSLVSSRPVPEGHYAAETMRQTVVPNRNMIMLSIAAGVAVARGGTYVATAVHAGDHAVYPDCRPAFIEAMTTALGIANEGFIPGGLTVEAPFQLRSKADIAELAARLGVPVADTWSCYLGGEMHCGRCGTCVERWGAFHDAGVPDPTVYADPDFARATLAATP